MAVPEELADLHVLIVDGNATNRRIFANYTASWGMRPGLSDSAAGALANLEFAAAQGDPYELVLAEDQLGDQSGLQLAERMAADPNLKQTPVVLLSHSRRGVVEASSQAIAAMVPKPVHQSKLLDAISSVMRDAGEIDEPAPVELRHIEPQGRRILVAEDHTVNWMLVERLLGKRGHLAVNATNGEQVLEKLQEEEFDLVLMDCQMPVLDGYETTRRLRELEAAGRRRIPVVAMTAHAMHGDRERCLAAGMDDYLAKPITSASIDAILARWLPSSPVSTEPLDPARMEELRSLFPGDEAAETIGQLQADVEGQLERLYAALRAGNGTEAAQAAHRIKGSAHMVGARMLAEVAAQVQAAAEHDPARGAQVAELLREQWQVVNEALELERTATPSTATGLSAA
jgi:CheY-like chemotaxis protein